MQRLCVCFVRLRQKLVATKQGIKQMKDQRKEHLMATYAALREQGRAAGRPSAQEDVAVLGSDGITRVKTSCWCLV